MNGSCANCYYYRWGGCTSRNANTTTNPATLLLANTSQTSAPAPNPLGAQLAPAPQLSSATQLGPVNFPVCKADYRTLAMSAPTVDEQKPTNDNSL